MEPQKNPRDRGGELWRFGVKVDLQLVTTKTGDI